MKSGGFGFQTVDLVWFVWILAGIGLFLLQLDRDTRRRLRARIRRRPRRH